MSFSFIDKDCSLSVIGISSISCTPFPVLHNDSGGLPLIIATGSFLILSVREFFPSLERIRPLGTILSKHTLLLSW